MDSFWHILTHWGRDKMDAISQTTFPSAFSWMKMFEFRLKVHWNLFLRVQLTIFQHWFRKWLGAVQATSHYLNQWWLVFRRIYASSGLNELTHWKTLFHLGWNIHMYEPHTAGGVLWEQATSFLDVTCGIIMIWCLFTYSSKYHILLTWINFTSSMDTWSHTQ